jgi:hypothetical protein
MFSSRYANRAPATRLFDVQETNGVSVNISGRLMLPSHDEFDCIAKEMTSVTATFACAGHTRKNDRIIAYLQHLGRIEGQVISSGQGEFIINIIATERKREKLAAQLAWIEKRNELGLPEDRRHDRLAPRKTKAEITLVDGSLLPCRIIDLSLSGAAVEIETRPPLGAIVRMGNMKGRIVRHFMEGVAIEFDSVQSRAALDQFL